MRRGLVQSRLDRSGLGKLNKCCNKGSIQPLCKWDRLVGLNSGGTAVVGEEEKKNPYALVIETLLFCGPLKKAMRYYEGGSAKLACFILQGFKCPESGVCGVSTCGTWSKGSLDPGTPCNVTGLLFQCDKGSMRPCLQCLLIRNWSDAACYAMCRALL
jgi:hypothetical protein